MCGDPDDTRRVNTLVLSEFAVPANVQFLLYDVEGALPDYIVGSLCFKLVRCAILIWLPISLVNILGPFGFYEVAKKMSMDPVLVSFAFV